VLHKQPELSKTSKHEAARLAWKVTAGRLYGNVRATKAFLLMFTEAIAEEMRNTGVRVMVACPGPTATQFFDQAPTTMKANQMDSAEFVAMRTLKDFEEGKVVSYPGRTSVRILT
jgi:hypothetical protein